MMQLLCNNVFLDLYTDQSVTFTRKNILLAFDDIEVERTAEFTLPATEVNMRVFGMAHIPAYDGTTIMSGLPSYLYIGTVVKSGVLIVNSYEGKEYHAVFYCGELLKLADIKASGKISEYLTRTNLGATATYDKTPMPSMNDPFICSGYCVPIEDTSQYPWNFSPRYPSINFAYIFQACCTYFGVSAAAPVLSGTFGYYLVPPTLINEDGEEAAVDDLCYAADNLPDVTFIDLIKTYAAITGTLPLIDDDGVLTFEDGSDFDSWDLVALSDIIKRGKVIRYTSGFAANNVVTEDGERIKGTYSNGNSTIEKEKTIYTSPFNGGLREASEYVPLIGDNRVMIWLDTDTFGIGYKSTSHPVEEQYFLHTLDANVYESSGTMTATQTNLFPTENILATVISAATSIEVEVKMTAMEFEQLQPKTRVLLDGTFYMWQSVTWADGIATLQLVKVK